MSKKTKKWYRRTHDFAPYTRADGKAVSDEFDAIQASFEKIPAMREDGLGFAESPIIPDPTEDNHPVPFHLLKTAERSVYAVKESVENLAQRVADNNNTTEQNTRSAIQANQQASQSQQLASQSATQAAEANKQAQQAQTQAQSQAQTATSASSSAQQSATQASESENLAQKWAANPVDEQVQGGKFSAYHYAAKARLSAEKAENIADGRKDWSDIDNVPISTDVNDNSKTNLASAFIVKTAYDKAVEAKELADNAQASAESAKSAADNAQQSADNALREVEEAKSLAKTAQNAADNASQIAGNKADVNHAHNAGDITGLNELIRGATTTEELVVGDFTVKKYSSGFVLIFFKKVIEVEFHYKSVKNKFVGGYSEYYYNRPVNFNLNGTFTLPINLINKITSLHYRNQIEHNGAFLDISSGGIELQEENNSLKYTSSYSGGDGYFISTGESLKLKSGRRNYYCEFLIFGTWK